MVWIPKEKRREIAKKYLRVYTRKQKTKRGRPTTTWIE